MSRQKASHSWLVRDGASRADAEREILTTLAEIEGKIRHAQQLVIEDTGCCEVLAETAAAQGALAQIARMLLLEQLRTRLRLLIDCDSDHSPALLQAVLDIFSTAASMPPQRDPVMQTKDRRA